MEFVQGRGGWGSRPTRYLLPPTAVVSYPSSCHFGARYGLSKKLSTMPMFCGWVQSTPIALSHELVRGERPCFIGERLLLGGE